MDVFSLILLCVLLCVRFSDVVVDKATIRNCRTAKISECSTCLEGEGREEGREGEVERDLEREEGRKRRRARRRKGGWKDQQKKKKHCLTIFLPARVSIPL